MDDAKFLRELGRRLREARASAALTVSETARRAEVSRRYVTEAEAGRANPSILILSRLARAVGVALGELVEPRRARGERVALVGLRGAGKSTVGRLLARELEVPFVELDRRVEELAGQPLDQLFDLHGPERYAALESEALEDVLAEGERSVIATGGSIVTRQATFDRLRETCTTVWLEATPEEHLRRVEAQGDLRPTRGRPRAMDELREILASRAPLYGRCRWRIGTTGRAPDDIAGEVVERMPR